MPAITDCRHYEITDTFVVSKKNNLIVLILDQAYPTYFSHHVTTLDYSLLFIICQNTKHFWNVYFYINPIFLSAQ